MSSARLTNSRGRIKADTLPSQPANGTSTHATSNAPTNRLVEYQAGLPAGTNGNGRCCPRRNGDPGPDRRAGNGRQHGHDHLLGASDERAVDQPVSHIETRNPSDLKPYPLQEHFFTDESEEADRQLAASMQKNGLREPVEILPDNTIIKGHRRTAAAKHNGWTTIRVVVRYDLVGNEKAIEEEFLEDNYMRRQMSPLLMAKCAKQLDELARAGKLTEYQLATAEGTTRVKIGCLLGVSGETVGRWCRILRAPLEVQLAFNAKKLKVDLAAKVCNLDEQVQKEIAAEIKSRGIEHAGAIVEEHMPPKAETRKGADKVYMKLKQAMHEAIKEGLVDNVERIGWQPHEDVQFWEDVEDLAIRMKLHIEEIYAEDEEDSDE